MLHRPPSPDRWRRYRKRRRARCMAPIVPDVGEAEITFLIRTQWLTESDAHDRDKVGSAISRMLTASARRK
jgi:hypothetical protein